MTTLESTYADAVASSSASNGIKWAPFRYADQTWVSDHGHLDGNRYYLSITVSVPPEWEPGTKLPDLLTSEVRIWSLDESPVCDETVTDPFDIGAGTERQVEALSRLIVRACRILLAPKD